MGKCTRVARGWKVGSEMFGRVVNLVWFGGGKRGLGFLVWGCKN